MEPYVLSGALWVLMEEAGLLAGDIIRYRIILGLTGAALFAMLGIGFYRVGHQKILADPDDCEVVTAGGFIKAVSVLIGSIGFVYWFNVFLQAVLAPRAAILTHFQDLLR